MLYTRDEAVRLMEEYEEQIKLFRRAIYEIEFPLCENLNYTYIHQLNSELSRTIELLSSAKKSIASGRRLKCANLSDIGNGQCCVANASEGVVTLCPYSDKNKDKCKDYKLV